MLHRFVHCPQAVLGGVSKVRKGKVFKGSLKVSSTYLESLKSAKEAVKRSSKKVMISYQKAF